MQVPQLEGPIPMDQKGRLGPRAMSEEWCHDTDYFQGAEFFFLNWLVVVEYMFLELF